MKLNKFHYIKRCLMRWDRRFGPEQHKDFHWRIIQKLVNKRFVQKEIIYLYLSLLRSLNPIVIFKAS